MYSWFVAAAVFRAGDHSPCIIGEGLRRLILFPASCSEDLSLLILYAVAAVYFYAVAVPVPYEAVLVVDNLNTTNFFMMKSRDMREKPNRKQLRKYL